MESFTRTPSLVAEARSGSPLQTEQDPQQPDAEAEQSEGRREEQDPAHGSRPGIVEKHVAHADPHVPEQCRREDKECDRSDWPGHPGVPLVEGTERLQRKGTDQEQEEEQHVDRAHALHPPGLQASEACPHHRTAAANSATATPARFTNQALRRANRSGEPMSKSVSRWRTPPSTCWASAQTANHAAALTANRVKSAVTCEKPASSRSERPSR